MIHVVNQEEKIFPHFAMDILVLTEPRNLAVGDTPNSSLNNLSTTGEQIECVNIELQARKQLRSISDPVAYRPFLPISDFQKNLLVLTYLQPIGKDFCQFFASSSRDSSRN